MNEPNEDIRSMLGGVPQYDARRGETVKKEVLAMFDRKIFWAKVLAWGMIAVETVVAFVGFLGMVDMLETSSLSGSQDVKWMILYAALAIAGIEGLTLAKLWYWQVHSRVTIQRELKEMQVQMAELAAKVGGAPTSGRETGQ